MRNCRVLGVDACKAGWAGIALSDGTMCAYFAAAISDLAEQASSSGPLDLIAVGMPIGLPDTGRRQADVFLRKLVGPRWTSVFIPVSISSGTAVSSDDVRSPLCMSSLVAPWPCHTNQSRPAVSLVITGGSGKSPSRRRVGDAMRQEVGALSDRPACEATYQYS